MLGQLILSEDLKGKIQPNLLYEVGLKEMHNGNGYVAVSAEIIQFPASFELITAVRRLSKSGFYSAIKPFISTL